MSERDITAALKTEVSGAVCYPVIFLYADFPSGIVRTQTGYGDLSWNSQTWTGIGELIKMEFVSEAVDSRASGLSVTVSGLQSDFFDPIMLGNYQGRDAKAWFGLMDTATSLPIADPYLLFSGGLDSDELSDDGKSSTLKINVENRLADLLRKRIYRYTHEDQQTLYSASNDKGLEFVGIMQDVSIKWGAT